jgi:4'-phosphopantetheinyl transferase
VDVEQQDSDVLAATDEGWLTPAEVTGLSALSGHRRIEATTRCWTQKEAVLKGQGVGLTRSPADVPTDLTPSARLGDWWVSHLRVPAGHVASLAVDGPVAPDVAPVTPLRPGSPA